jgi:hypothetical protein
VLPGSKVPEGLGSPTIFALVADWREDYCFVVSAVELFKQIKALPPRVRQKFVLAVLSLEEETAGQTLGKARRVKWPDVEARAKRIFGERMLPNLVLLEREESLF